jgi:peptidyl-tRNA hydrolase
VVRDLNSLENLRQIIVVNGAVKDVLGRPMPDGMAAAQAAHASVKACFERVYAEHGKSSREHAIDLFKDINFTKVVLRARDEKELEHIRLLAENANIIYAEMWDSNPAFYGHYGTVLTAVAFEPLPEESLEGVTDYLPLW